MNVLNVCGEYICFELFPNKSWGGKVLGRDGFKSDDEVDFLISELARFTLS